MSAAVGVALCGPSLALGQSLKAQIVGAWRTTSIYNSFPNRAGTPEKRMYKISGDEITSVNPTAASGAARIRSSFE